MRMPATPASKTTRVDKCMITSNGLMLRRDDTAASRLPRGETRLPRHGSLGGNRGEYGRTAARHRQSGLRLSRLQGHRIEREAVDRELAVAKLELRFHPGAIADDITVLDQCLDLPSAHLQTFKIAKQSQSTVVKSATRSLVLRSNPYRYITVRHQTISTVVLQIFIYPFRRIARRL